MEVDFNMDHLRNAQQWLDQAESLHDTMEERLSAATDPTFTVKFNRLIDLAKAEAQAGILQQLQWISMVIAEAKEEAEKEG